MAWLTTRTDLPFARFWLIVGLLTMVIPSYLGATTYLSMFGEQGHLTIMVGTIRSGTLARYSWVLRRMVHINAIHLHLT